MRETELMANFKLYLHKNVFSTWHHEYHHPYISQLTVLVETQLLLRTHKAVSIYM